MLKRVYILVVMITVSLSGFSQYKVDYGFSVGAANYLGEIGGAEDERRGFVSDMKLDYTRWTIGGFYRYRISPKFAFKGTLNYIRLSADDSKTTNPHRKGRNLSFKNDMFELASHLEFYFYRVNDVGGSGRYSTDFNLYLFAGAGLFYSNPKGELNGEWYALQPLQTEGVEYSKINFSIPTGLGFYYTMQKKYRLGMEIGWRTTFTDYIDDISDKYVLHTDPLTASLANKNNQAIIDGIEPLGEGAPFPSVRTYEPGDKRGDPSHNDSYLTATVNFSWAIRGRSNFYKSRHNWVLGKNKRKRRKSRAKF